VYVFFWLFPPTFLWQLIFEPNYSDGLVSSSPLLSGDLLIRAKQMADLEALHEFHRLLSVLAAAHGRIEVPKLHGRISAMIFSSPEDALSKQTALHMLEVELLNKYETKYGSTTSSTTTTTTSSTESAATPLPSNDACGTYFFWILTANYTARDKGAIELEKNYPNITKWMSIKKKAKYIQDICEQNTEIKSLRYRFRKTLSYQTMNDSNDTIKSLSNLNTKSPLSEAIAKLKLLSASLHLSSEHEAEMHAVLGKLKITNILLIFGIHY
jgi:hypothetical protein